MARRRGGGGGDRHALIEGLCAGQVNELVKRARLAKVHAYIISHLRAEMPALWGKEAKQRELIDKLNVVFFELHKKHHLPVGDFPPLARMRELLVHCDFKKFNKLNQSLIDSMDEVLGRDIPGLMRQLGTHARCSLCRSVRRSRGGGLLQAKSTLRRGCRRSSRRRSPAAFRCLSVWAQALVQAPAQAQPRFRRRESTWTSCLSPRRVQCLSASTRRTTLPSCTLWTKS